MATAKKLGKHMLRDVMQYILVGVVRKYIEDSLQSLGYFDNS